MFRATVGDGEPHARFRAEVPRSVATTPTVHRARAEVPRSPPVGGEEKRKKESRAPRIQPMGFEFDTSPLTCPIFYPIQTRNRSKQSPDEKRTKHVEGGVNGDVQGESSLIFGKIGLLT